MKLKLKPKCRWDCVKVLFPSRDAQKNMFIHLSVPKSRGSLFPLNFCFLKVFVDFEH